MLKQTYASHTPEIIVSKKNDVCTASQIENEIEDESV